MSNKVALVARFFLGLVFFVFGLNGFFNFIALPPLPPDAGQFLGALGATGYMFPLIKGIEVLGGAMLLGGVQIPLALLLLSPITVNIFLFHLIMTGVATAGLPTLMGLSLIILANRHWSHFRPIFARD